MKAWLTKNEVYPVYSVTEKEEFMNPGDEVEVPQELFDRFNRVQALFDAVQEELREIYYQQLLT